MNRYTRRTSPAYRRLKRYSIKDRVLPDMQTLRAIRHDLIEIDSLLQYFVTDEDMKHIAIAEELTSLGLVSPMKDLIESAKYMKRDIDSFLGTLKMAITDLENLR